MPNTKYQSNYKLETNDSTTLVLLHGYTAVTEHLDLIHCITAYWSCALHYGSIFHHTLHDIRYVQYALHLEKISGEHRRKLVVLGVIHYMHGTTY